jgi:hypothetical protein
VYRKRLSLLKNPLGARFDPGSGTNRAGFGAFGARFAGAIGPMPTFSTVHHGPCRATPKP